MLAVADMHAVEPYGGLAGGANAWLRAGTYANVSEDVTSAPGLVRFRQLGPLHWYTPGIFLTANRDAVGSAYRLLLEQCRAFFQLFTSAHANLRLAIHGVFTE